MGVDQKRRGSQADICAVICTCGLRRTLAATVASLARQSLDAARYEIVIVLNRNSGSCLRKLEAAIAAVEGSCKVVLRIVTEPTPGLSIARNRGIAATRAKYIAFIDDDARADCDWLANILACFHRDERIALGGGRHFAAVGVSAPVLGTIPDVHLLLM